MSERRPWTLQEDNILQKLFEVDGIKKWSEISRLMEQDHNIPGRNGKQCRERYHNHLKGGIRRDKWTPEEEDQLVTLHAQHGNRWSYISKLIEGRPENCVKNMLYSKMRKSVRQLNRFSYIYFRRVLKQIKLSFVNRLIDITETAYKKVEIERTETEKAAIDIKNQILRLTFDQSQEMGEQEKERVKKLVDQIHNFKKENQKYHRGVTLTKIKKQKLKKKESWEVNSQDDMLDESEDNIEEGRKNKKLPKVKVETTDNLPSINKMIYRKSTKESFKEKHIEKIQKPEKNGIQTESSCDTPKQPEPVAMLAENLRSKVEVLRPDSLGQDFLNLMEEKDLNRPIQCEEQCGLSPSPYARQYSVNWSNQQQLWKGYEI